MKLSQKKKNIGHYYDLNATEEADRKGLMKETDRRRSIFLRNGLPIEGEDASKEAWKVRG